MHIIVIGAGIVGMTTAWYLARDGHSVSVVDAAAAPGQLTSQANGAQLSYSFVAPLADPAVLPKLPSWLLGRETPLRLHLRADLDQWRWGLAFLRACRRSQAHRTTAELLQLGLHSRRLVHELVAQAQPEFDFKPSGKLLIYQNPASYTAALGQVNYQATLGCEQIVLNRQACLEREPALADIADRIAGGIYTATEDAGDCQRLCCELERLLRTAANPVRFHFGTQVRGLRANAAGIDALDTDAGDMQADAYVIANGVDAQRLARGVGLEPSIYPLKGYSLTYELTDSSRAPLTSVSDVHNKVVYARLGQRLRVAGMVDIGARGTAVDPVRIATLEREVAAYFPRLAAAAPPQAWAGLRPARPDGKPVIGATRYRNLWLNAGHGGLGFTLAAGSARLLADQITGLTSFMPPEIFALKT